MDTILEPVRKVWEGEIDFQGQYLAELLTNYMLAITGILAFVSGFALQNIYYTLYVGLGGTALTFLVVVPPWPFFNQNPSRWLPAKTSPLAGLQGIDIQVDGKKVG